MSYLNIDHLILALFFLITLMIGLRAGRGIKDIREYATANKIFGTGALVLTWLATDIAGETVLDMTSAVRTVGIIQPLVVFGGCGIALLVQALFFAPKFTRFSGCMTMGDVMGQLYESPSQVMTGLLGFFTALCIAGMELTVLGILCENLLGIDFRFGIGVGGLLLVLYTAHGGIKAVAFTDLFQGLILFVVVPIIMIAALKQTGGVEDVLKRVPATQLQVLEHPQMSYYLSLFLSLSIFQFSVIDPALVQRILMGRTPLQLRHQFLIVATCLVALMLALSLLGLASMVMYPEATDVPIMLRVVGDILPVGLKGLAMAGLFAITMATFDSFLHAAGLTLVHDVIRPLCKSHTFDELKWVRHVTSLVGAIVIGIGMLRADNLYNLVLLSYKFTGPLLAFPLFSGVCGLRPDRRAYYVASGVTVVVLLCSEWFLPLSQNHWVPIVSVVTNGIVFLGMHAIRNRGFVIVDRDKSAEYFWHPRRASVLTRLKHWLPTPQRIARYSQRQVEHYGAPYALFGVFCCVNYLFPYFMWEHTSPAMYDLMLYLRAIGAMSCGLLLMKDKWPKSLIPYLPTFWHLTLLYCLPFTSTVMFLTTQGSVEWLINIAITIMFLIVLVDWLSFVILTFLGLALGFLFYQIAVGPISLQLDFSTGYLLVYTCVFTTLITLLFARRKEQHLEAKLREIADHYYKLDPTKTDVHPAAIRIANMIDHQVQEHIATYSLPLRSTNDAYRSDAFHTDTACLHYFFPTALAVIRQGAQMLEQIVLALKDHYIAPQRSSLSVQACVATILEAYHRHHLPTVQVDTSRDYQISASFHHLQYALIHVLRFLHSYYKGETIRLWITQQEGIHLRLPGQALSSTLIHELFSLFPPKEYTKHMGLALSRLLLEAHGGDLLCRMQALPHEAYTEFVLRVAPVSASDLVQ